MPFLYNLHHCIPDVFKSSTLNKPLTSIRTFSSSVLLLKSFLISSRLNALNSLCATATMTQSASLTSSSFVSVTPYSCIASLSLAHGSTTTGSIP